MGIIQELLKIFANRTDPEMVKREDRKKVEEKVQAAIKASRQGDTAKVNSILRNKWFRCVALSACSIGLQGCASTPQLMIVPSSEAVLPLEYNSVPGWFVPQPIFERMTEAVVRQQNKE
jgi:hypothetical protein